MNFLTVTFLYNPVERLDQYQLTYKHESLWVLARRRAARFVRENGMKTE